MIVFWLLLRLGDSGKVVKESTPVHDIEFVARYV